MATRYAVPGATDWGSTTSWASTLGGSSGASVPADGDTVYIVVPVRFSAGLDQSSVTLAAIYITDGCNDGYIGQAGNPIKIGSTVCYVSAVVPMYLRSGTDDLSIVHLFSSPNGNCTLMGGIGTVYCGPSGSVAFDSATVVSGIYSTGMGVTILSTCSMSSAGATMYAGSLLCLTSMQAISLHGRSQVRVVGQGVAIGSVIVTGGARYTHQSSGTIVSAGVYTGGRADAAGSPYSFAVTYLTRGANAYAWDQESVSVSVSNLSTIGYM